MEYSIGAFSKMTGISASALRYYEKEGLLCAPRDNAGRRRYGGADAAWVEFIVRLKETGMPIREIREYARLRALGDGTMKQRMEMLQKHREHVLEEQERIGRNLEKLEQKLEFYAERLKDMQGQEPCNQKKRCTRV